VNHAKFGKGVVVEVDGKQVHVLFERVCASCSTACLVNQHARRCGAAAVSGPDDLVPRAERS